MYGTKAAGPGYGPPSKADAAKLADDGEDGEGDEEDGKGEAEEMEE